MSYSKKAIIEALHRTHGMIFLAAKEIGCAPVTIYRRAAKDKKIQDLESEIAKNTFDGKQILQKAKIIFPAIQSLSISNSRFYYGNDSTSSSVILFYKADEELADTEKIKLTNWIKKRNNLLDLKLIYYK